MHAAHQDLFDPLGPAMISGDLGSLRRAKTAESNLAQAWPRSG